MPVFRTLIRLGPSLLAVAAWIPGIAQERGPELRALTFTPNAIDTSSSPARVIVNFQTVDRGLGATSFEIGFTSPSGAHSEKAAASFAATASFAGSVAVAFPALCEPGAWTISHVLLANAEGYSRFLSEQDLRAQGLPTSLRVMSRTDTSNPTVTSFRFAPASVDITSGPADVSIELEAQDDLSGVKAVEVSFDSPSGIDKRHVSATLPSPSISAKIPLVMKFAPSAEAGAWRVVAVIVADAAGNTLVMSADDLAGRGFPTALEVRKIIDTTPPTLTEFKVSPSRINVASGPSAVKIEFALADDLSGVAGLEISFLGPSRIIARKAEKVFKPARQVTGSVTVEFPRLSETGDWQVAALLLVDAAGNTRVLNAGELTAKGFPNSVLVASEAPAGLPDTTPPNLTAFSVSPSTISAATERVTVTFGFSVADEESGVNAVQIGIVSPSGTITRNASANFAAARSYSGAVTVELPRSPEPGDWEIATLVVTDVSGNTRVLNAQDLRDRGLPSRLRVTSGVTAQVETNVAEATVLLAGAGVEQPAAGFDLRIELYFDTVLTAAGQTLCIAGLTNDPAAAKSVSVSLDAAPGRSNAPGTLSVRVLTRIGTSPSGARCGGAAKSTGLRMYSGTVDSPSRLVLGPALDTRVTLFLQDSNGTHILAQGLPSAATVIASESGSLDFDSGNPWKEVGVWRMAQ